MNLSIQLFAGLAEALGTSRVELSLTDHPAPTVVHLIEALCEQQPEHSHLIRQCFPAVNQSYASPDTPLQPSDEIALIPPVSGG